MKNSTICLSINGAAAIVHTGAKQNNKQQLKKPSS
jgi:hypothetical protein